MGYNEFKRRVLFSKPHKTYVQLSISLPFSSILFRIACKQLCEKNLNCKDTFRLIIMSFYFAACSLRERLIIQPKQIF